MNEERMMILRMIEEKKITAEQGAALLRALPGDHGAANSPGAAGATSPPHFGPGSAPPPPLPPNEPFLDMQGRLADLQSKLGELQSKLGAAQSSSSSSSGRTSLPFGLGDINFGQIFDETLKGVTSLKSEALKTAKMAARIAQKETRKMRQEARRAGKSVRVEINFAMDGNGRPKNEDGDPEQTEVEEQSLTLPGERALTILNKLGDIKAVAVAEGEPITLKVTKKVWGQTELLPGVLASVKAQVIAGQDGVAERIVLEAPELDTDAVTADLELRLPASTLLALETTFGDIHGEGFTRGLSRAESVSGEIRLLHLQSDGQEGDATLRSRSGDVSVHQWKGGPIHADTISGDVRLDGFTAPLGVVRSRSGSVQIMNLMATSDVSVETSSGEIEVSGGVCHQALTVRTQSGDVKVASLRAGRAQIETVSGDLEAEDIAAVDGSLSLKSVSGDLRTSGLQSVAVNVNTVSGDAEVAFAAPFTGSLGATTISGDLRVALWSNSDAKVEMTTQSGSIACDLPLEQRTQNGDRFLSGTLAGGQGSVKLSSVSGDLSLKTQA